MLIYFSHELLIFALFFLVSYIWGIHPATDVLLKSTHQSRDKLTRPTIKILSWNIGKNKKSSWLSEFSGVFHNYKPDIFIFQEVKLEEKIKSGLKKNSLAWRFSPNIVNLKKQLYSGVLTASSVLPHTETFKKSTSREPVTFTPKSTLFTSYAIDNSDESLLVINIHGINFVSLRNFRSQIHEIIEHGQEHKGPIIFSGDFNTWNKNRKRFLEKILKRKLNLVPVGFEKSHQRKIKKFIFSPPLDHIFYSYKKLQLVKNSSKVLRNCKSSDHKPIFAEFRLIAKPDKLAEFDTENVLTIEPAIS